MDAVREYSKAGDADATGSQRDEGEPSRTLYHHTLTLSQRRTAAAVSFGRRCGAASECGYSCRAHACGNVAGLERTVDN